MIKGITLGKDFIERKYQGEYLRIEAWSKDCIRVRCTIENELKPYDWTIQPKQENLPVKVEQDGDKVVLRNGSLSVSVSKVEVGEFVSEEATLCFIDSQSGTLLLEERASRIVFPDPGHRVKAVGLSTYRVEARFKADPNEKFYGLGHNQYGFLNQKGCVMELRQMNTHTVVPVLYSSKGYGFFWNNPGYGRVELANNGTFWIAEQTDQLDYFVFNGDSPAEIMNNYADLTGYPPMMPEWAMGFWHCKQRYQNRDQLMAVARRHKELGLPMSVIVIDFFHWDKMGEWDFDPKCWPDPEGMLKELKEMGIETMVSIWPTVNANSSHFQEMEDKGYLIRAENNHPVFMKFMDTYEKNRYLHFVDFTNPDAGRYVWNICRKNYYDKGVRLFWLDECEPEVPPYCNHNMRYYIGNGGKYSSLYPLFEEKSFFEGLKEAGEDLPINLCRSAWAGSQKYGACVWSGDIMSNFNALSDQIKNGLNMAMAGIPWWTTDIGGFFGGNIDDPVFRELVVRWFQWGVFCPVFRLHGERESGVKERLRDEGNINTGADNEVWSFGEVAFKIIRELLFMRESLRPYIKEQMKRAHRNGTPPMRPLFFDFPEDPVTYDIDDELMYGPDILAAPVCEYQQRSRSVYLPAGADWYDVRTGEKFKGGDHVEVLAPLECIPVFVRNRKKFW